ncbi:ABC transporter substrate-binding protein [Paenibacillus thailandensis]|uniref:ABC transporter substrate-binding protein n=1 Tax=Paenibacillus thailandensis TaxID=393250 RepID=A0ABW5R0G7_9BACL
MQALERYLELYERFGNAGGAGASAETSLGQIAEALYCTERNAKLVLRKLEEEGLIEWKAGRGRGNRSRLVFLADKGELLFGASKSYAEAGEYNKAYELLRAYGGDTGAGERFVDWMNGRFGFGKEQKEGTDVLRLPVYQPIVTLDPAEAMFSLSGHLILQLFDRLVQSDRTGKIVPAVAHHWECGAEGMEWTFHLRKGVIFHNGKELNAADVVYTLERLRERRNGWIVRTLDRAEAISPRIVKIYLNKPNRLFLRFLCSVAMSVLPCDLGGQSEDNYWRRPAGTGPFQIESWSEDRVILQANPHYYQGRPHLDSVDIVVMPEEGLLGRDRDVLSWQQLLCEPEEREIKPENGWELKESQDGCTSLLTWNMNKDGPHRTLAFRRAVDALIDRNAMIAELGDYRDRAASGFFFDPDSPRDHTDSGRQEVLQLLKQAGYDGEPVALAAYGKHAKDAEWIARRCAEFGIEVRLLIGTSENIHRYLGEADAILHAIVFPEEEVCLIENYVQEGSFVKEYQDPGMQSWITEKIDLALGFEQLQERQAFYGEIERRLKDEARISFLLHAKFYTNYHPSFKGVTINQHGWIDFKDVWRE